LTEWSWAWGRGLSNLACKLRHLVLHVGAWLSSWSCAHVMVRCDAVLLCRLWQHYRHSGGSLAVLRDAVFIMAFVIASWSSRGVVQELVAAPRSSIAWLACEASGHDPELRGHGSCWFGWPLCQGLCHGSHPTVGRIVRAPCWAVFGRRVTVLTVTTMRCCLVRVAWCRDGVWSDRGDRCVPLVLVRSVQHAYSC
jgi:hypothetical protein